MTTLDTETTEAGTQESDAALQSSRRGWHAPVAVAVVVLLLGVATALLARQPGPTDHPAQASTPAPTTTDAAMATRLAAIADLITTTPEDSQPGRYTYLEIEHWSRRDGTEIVGFRERIWRHGSDGSTHISQRQLPAQPAKGFDETQIGRTSFDHVPPVVADYTAAESHSFAERHGATPSSNPTELTRQLDAESTGTGSPAPCPPTCGRTTTVHMFVQNLIGLHREEYLDREVRAAVLRIVGTLPGITYGGQAVDRAGRPGIAISVDADGAQFTLIFDQNNGFLLASQRTVPGVVLDDYTLYLTRGRTDHLD